MRDAHPAIPQSRTFLLEDCALPSQHLLGGDASQSLRVNEVPAHRQVFCAPTDEQAEGWQGPGPPGRGLGLAAKVSFKWKSMDLTQTTSRC